MCYILFIGNTTFVYEYRRYSYLVVLEKALYCFIRRAHQPETLYYVLVYDNIIYYIFMIM